MHITETVTVTREIYVAPCINCGSEEIKITDCGYSTFNKGGGECSHCGHAVSKTVGWNPSKKDLAAIWNAGNDPKVLIEAEKAKIAAAQERIKELEHLLPR